MILADFTQTFAKTISEKYFQKTLKKSKISIESYYSFFSFALLFRFYGQK